MNYQATLLSFAICTALIFAELPLLKRLNAKQEILEYVTEHNSKKGTPTMGGIAFILAIVTVALLFCQRTQTLCVTLVVFVGYGVIGFLDDLIKIKNKRNLGLKAYQKIIVQLAIAVIVAVFVYKEPSIGDEVIIPFVKTTWHLGKWVIPFVVFIYLACTNGVNLTDGLDGLSTTTTISFLVGIVGLVKQEQNNLLSNGEMLAYAQCENVITLCFVAIGALFAFLLFNCFPAKVFMGDTGSLALGALVACTAIFTRLSLFIPIVGIMFVVSCVSVIVQVVYFKLSGGKRVFLMAPYHHHLQKKGISETRIAMIYSSVTLAFSLILLVVGEL